VTAGGHRQKKLLIFTFTHRKKRRMSREARNEKEAMDRKRIL
tara:strand:- start:1259 stop:1384 length:126 start_codon:yes stop_codon:yes gene_type:complete